MTITAAEARQITKTAVQGPEIERYVKTLEKHIKASAEKGLSTILPWNYLGSLRGTMPTESEKMAIRKYFEKQGFEWTDYSEGDHGHLRSCSLLGW